MATKWQWTFRLTPSSPPPSHQDPEVSHTGTGSTSDPSVHISMRNHTYAHSFFVGLSTELSPGPLLEVGVDVTSNMRTHELRVEIPANSRQALASTLISAFRNINQLIVYADSFEFKIKFSPHEVDVAAASALIDSNGVLIIRVQRLRSWVYAHTLLTL